jgi:diguanylate cyclase (GGDEF)-like protein
VDVDRPDRVVMRHADVAAARRRDGAGAPPSVDPTDATARRVRPLRVAALRGSIIPAVTAVYSLATPHQPNRPWMLAVSGLLLCVSWGVALSAPGIVRSGLRLPVNAAALLAHLVGYGVLSQLDGGVTAPLGPLVFVSLPFLAISVPTRLFSAFAAIAVVVYWTVTLAPDRSPVAYAAVYTTGYLLVSFVCAHHAHSLAGLRRRLTDLSRVDPLTGCLNRRGFDERLAEERSRSDRTGSPVTVVLVDLDSFKAVNDTLGHQVGDQLLAWTGRTLRAAGRTGDAVGRLGGDEFAMILDGAGPSEAAVVVERIRSKLDEASPASLGRATYPDEVADLDQLTQLADQRLYADKAARGAVAVEPEAVAVAARGASAASTRVEAHERARVVITSIGWMTVCNVLIAVTYLSLASGRRLDDLVVNLLVVPGVVGAVMLLAADPLARSRLASRAISYVFGPMLLGMVAVTAVVDGGVSSPLAFGMLNSLPLVALSSHWRIAAPVCTLTAAAYVVMGVTLGAPSVWHIVIHLLGILAIATACAVQARTAAHQRRLLHRLSRVDSLTDSLNRRGFEERFDTELAHAERHGRALTLVLLDLDDFKSLNDSEGHAAGDELLRWVATTLSGLVRRHDVTGRLGGDEFIGLLTDCPIEEVCVITDRIRTTLAARTSVSIGTATLGVDGTDFDSLYRAADAHLYDEKARRKASPAERRA